MRNTVTAHRQLVKGTNLTAEMQDSHNEFMTPVVSGLTSVAEDLSDPTVIKSHVEGLKNTDPILPHDQLLDKMLSGLQKIDFKPLVFLYLKNINEQLETGETRSLESGDIEKEIEKISVNVKHYRILAIEQIIKKAVQNNWGLCKYNDLFYLYNSAYWSEVDRSELEVFLGQAAEKIGVPWDNAKDYKFREQLVRQFMGTQNLKKPVADKNKVLINLLNGTFEVGTEGTKMQTFQRADFMTYQLPFKYDPLAKAPLFEKFLNRVLPDIDSQKVLAEYLGYIFIKRGSDFMKEEKALILYGTGANGKSVVFEVVKALLGFQNICNFSLQSLTDVGGQYRAQLENKLLNYASEINGNLESAIFKILVSGEPVDVKLLYRNPYIMYEYAKLIFNCNELPKDVEHTDAFFRRFLILPFNVTIPPEEQDKNLHKKIIDNELAGVFNWVLAGLARLRIQQKFSECQASREAVEKYRNESDTVRLFLNESAYEISIINEVSLKELYNEYKYFCVEGNYRQCSNKTFSGRLKNIGYILKRKNYGWAVMAEKKEFY